MKKHPFYAILLTHMKYALDEKCQTAYTDGCRIAFSPEFMKKLSDSELDFVLMHEILHVALCHCARTKDGMDNELFNIACDIVVNSNILYSNNMDRSTITLAEFGEAMNMVPDGRNGYECSAEEVYDILVNKSKQDDKRRFDDHGKWKNSDDGDEMFTWQARVVSAAKSVLENQTPGGEKTTAYGDVPLLVNRMLKDLLSPQTDWKTILHDFLQDEVNDYSFLPPDRRMSDSGFFLPDFNEKDFCVKDILFMVDTSGSMSDETITKCFSEIKGAIDQFDGKLSGWLGFFDAAVEAPKPFSSYEEFKAIHPIGGGGTSFKAVFDYVQTDMTDNLPAYVIILTDGYAEFPEEKAAMGIPVLWMITNRDINPPWGKTARID